MSDWLHIDGTVFFRKQHAVAVSTIIDIVSEFFWSLQLDDTPEVYINESKLYIQNKYKLFIQEKTLKGHSAFTEPSTLTIRIEERSPNTNSDEVIAELTKFIDTLTQNFGFLSTYLFKVTNSSDYSAIISDATTNNRVTTTDQLYRSKKDITVTKLYD